LAFAPTRTGSAGGCASSERTLTPGSPRTGPGPSGAERPTLPAWSRTAATSWYVPGGAGAPPARPSHSPSRTPGGSVNASTSRGSPRSVRTTDMRVGRRSDTTRTRNGTGRARGPVIHFVPSGPPASTVGRGAVTSSENPGFSVTARPPRRRLTRRR
jgi:hypothetical protein